MLVHVRNSGESRFYTKTVPNNATRFMSKLLVLLSVATYKKYIVNVLCYFIV